MSKTLLSSLASLDNLAAVAKTAASQKARFERAFELATEARKRQITVAREAHRALHQPIEAFPWGSLAVLPQEGPTDPFDRAIWLKARSVKRAIIAEAAEAVASAAEEVNNLLDKLGDEFPEMLPQIGEHRPFASLEEAMQAVARGTQKAKAKGKKAKARRSAPKAAKAKPKTKGKSKAKKASEAKEAERVLKSWGASVFHAPSGVVQASHPKFGRVDLPKDVWGNIAPSAAALGLAAAKEAAKEGGISLAAAKEIALEVAFAALRGAAEKERARKAAL